MTFADFLIIMFLAFVLIAPQNIRLFVGRNVAKFSFFFACLFLFVAFKYNSYPLGVFGILIFIIFIMSISLYIKFILSLCRAYLINIGNKKLFFCKKDDLFTGNELKKRYNCFNNFLDNDVFNAVEIKNKVKESLIQKYIQDCKIFKF